MAEEVKLEPCLHGQGFLLTHDHPHVICSFQSSSAVDFPYLIGNYTAKGSACVICVVCYCQKQDMELDNILSELVSPSYSLL